MNHQMAGRKLGRSLTQRNGLRRTMLKQLVEHERIKTTEAKAKFIRGELERLITTAKRGLKAGAGDTPVAKARVVHARRMAQAKLDDAKLVKKLFDTIAPRYEKRPSAMSVNDDGNTSAGSPLVRRPARARRSTSRGA